VCLSQPEEFWSASPVLWSAYAFHSVVIHPPTWHERSTNRGGGKIFLSKPYLCALLAYRRSPSGRSSSAVDASAAGVRNGFARSLPTASTVSPPALAGRATTPRAVASMPSGLAQRENDACGSWGHIGHRHRLRSSSAVLKFARAGVMKFCGSAEPIEGRLYIQPQAPFLVV
jgi:hypothetical protein